VPHFVPAALFIANCVLFLLFFNATSTPEIYTLSLHDALPIFYRILTERVLRSLPRAESSDGKTESLTRGVVRDKVFGRFVELFRSEEHTSELQSQSNLVCRLLLEKKKNRKHHHASLSAEDPAT